ncbi:MAG TPA: hypothetical protein VM925_09985 [Labilithrix sp.]|jgi:hypothetical protein|nr:hypothetical protein [Labilithrix sp.]
MLPIYRDEMTMREARTVYFEANGFGETGGYEDAWVDFKLGPIPMPFPNTKARIEAVRHHDLHHLLTGYGTDIVGEFEISAWEIGAGCKHMVAAWALNLGGMAGGLLRSPSRVFAAFVRGRSERTTYGEKLDDVLDLTVAEARACFTRPERAARRATAGDVALFVAATVSGIVVALLLLALIVPLVPFGLLAHAMRQRATPGLAK